MKLAWRDNVDFHVSYTSIPLYLLRLVDVEDGILEVKTKLHLTSRQRITGSVNTDK